MAPSVEGPVEEVHASVSHQRQSEGEFRVRANSQQSRQGFDVDSLGLSLQLQSPSPVGRWVYGAEYYRDWVNSHSRQYNAAGALTAVDIQGPVAADSTYDLFGLYAQNSLPLGDRLEFTLGGRFSYSGADAGRVRDPVMGAPTSFQADWTAAVGSGRLLWQLDEQARWHWFGGVSQGFRAPNLSDLTRFDIAGSGELETPSPGLRPEAFLSYETGFKFSHERVSAQAAYFYTDIDDLIVRTPTGNIVNGAREVVKLNSGSGYVHGVELSGDWRFHPQFTARSAFTWMQGNLTTYSAATPNPVTQREPLSRVMPVTLQLGLLWEAPSRRWWTEFAATLVARQARLSSADARDTQRIPPGGTPGYDVYTLRVGWRPCRNASLTAAIENLTDRDYRIHGSGLNEAGRNFIFAAECRF